MEDSNSLDDIFSDEIEQLIEPETINVLHNKEVPTAAVNEEQREGSKKCRRMSSSVWVNYDMLSNQPDGKQRCKCKKYGAVYLCDSKNRTSNLRRHMENCKKRDIRDIGQLILQRPSFSSSSLTMSDNKFD